MDSAHYYSFYKVCARRWLEYTRLYRLGGEKQKASCFCAPIARIFVAKALANRPQRQASHI